MAPAAGSKRKPTDLGSKDNSKKRNKNDVSTTKTPKTRRGPPSKPTIEMTTEVSACTSVAIMLGPDEDIDHSDKMIACANLAIEVCGYQPTDVCLPMTKKQIMQLNKELQENDYKPLPFQINGGKQGTMRLHVKKAWEDFQKTHAQQHGSTMALNNGNVIQTPSWDRVQVLWSQFAKVCRHVWMTNTHLSREDAAELGNRIVSLMIRTENAYLRSFFPKYNRQLRFEMALQSLKLFEADHLDGVITADQNEKSVEHIQVILGHLYLKKGGPPRKILERLKDWFNNLTEELWQDSFLVTTREDRCDRLMSDFTWISSLEMAETKAEMDKRVEAEQKEARKKERQAKKEAKANATVAKEDGDESDKVDEVAKVGGEPKEDEVLTTTNNVTAKDGEPKEDEVDETTKVNETPKDDDNKPKEDGEEPPKGVESAKADEPTKEPPKGDKSAKGDEPTEPTKANGPTMEPPKGDKAEEPTKEPPKGDKSAKGDEPTEPAKADEPTKEPPKGDESANGDEPTKDDDKEPKEDAQPKDDGASKTNPEAKEHESAKKGDPKSCQPMEPRTILRRRTKEDRPPSKPVDTSSKKVKPKGGNPMQPRNTIQRATFCDSLSTTKVYHPGESPASADVWSLKIIVNGELFDAKTAFIKIKKNMEAPTPMEMKNLVSLDDMADVESKITSTRMTILSSSSKEYVLRTKVPAKQKGKESFAKPPKDWADVKIFQFSAIQALVNTLGVFYSVKYLSPKEIELKKMTDMARSAAVKCGFITPQTKQKKHIQGSVNVWMPAILAESFLGYMCILEQMLGREHSPPEVYVHNYKCARSALNSGRFTTEDAQSLSMIIDMMIEVSDLTKD